MELAKVYDELYGMIADLRKQIGSGGGGGIEINPEGAATADLEKIKKGSDIYGLNYNKNANRPQVNGNLLTGNKNSKQLNIAEEMSEAAYTALASKNENEIYFLTENAPIFTETDTVAASGITWTAGEDPDTYEATLSYTVVDTDTTGVVGVTCDNELITIGDPTFSTGTVSVPMVCADPSEITRDIEFIFTLEQPAGGKKIVHNGEEYGYDIYSTTPQKIGRWINGHDLYRVVLQTDQQVSVTDVAWTVGSWLNEPEDVEELIKAELTSTCPNDGNIYRFRALDGHINVASKSSGSFPAVSGTYEVIVYYTISQ